MSTKVTRSGQITLDANLRKELGIEVGTPIEVNRLGDLIVIAKKDKNFWEKYTSVLPKNFDRTLNALRKDSRKRLKRLKIT